jgi:hypothetical protein
MLFSGALQKRKPATSVEQAWDAPGAPMSPCKCPALLTQHRHPPPLPSTLASTNAVCAVSLHLEHYQHGANTDLDETKGPQHARQRGGCHGQDCALATLAPAPPAASLLPCCCTCRRPNIKALGCNLWELKLMSGHVHAFTCRHLHVEAAGESSPGLHTMLAALIPLQLTVFVVAGGLLHCHDVLRTAHAAGQGKAL